MSNRIVRGIPGLAPLAGVVMMGAMTGAAQAQSAGDFFKGKDISMYVASGAGGGYDVYARVFTRHYSNHIPGRPNIVVKNMPGASGLKAMNYIYNVAPRDGTAQLATFNTVVLQPLYGESNAKFDPRKMGWIGSIGKQTGTCVTWHGTSIKSIADAQKQEVLVGATGANATPTIYPKLLNQIAGTRFKVVTGYETTGVRLALERGEIQGICGIAWETHMAARPDWILQKKVNFLLQLGLDPSARLPGVPMARDLIKDPDNRKVFELLVIPAEFGRPFVAPPGLPVDRLAALQQAFTAAMTDKGYVADTEKTKQFIDALTGKQIEGLIARAYEAPPDIIRRAAVYAIGSEPKKKKKN